ncbi:glycosyltransferase family protein [Vibrio fortis]|jgi:spore coat polysaccharide biosynthesis protein SpsF (cytidylyltransferase family)|uniref:glycosyltransferase family protein n=1 Tax=Vibrio fortis TaxID=212667 RepID=UPI0021C4C019|nr:glycosyltransferase family protein [Vibrio fortis]
MSVIAILQARVSSSRLPSKVLRPIFDKPMLHYQVERVLQSKLIDKLIIATSENPEDTPLETLAQSLNVECFRGDLDDVLDRFYRAAAVHSPNHVVRLTGDCPLIDPNVIDKIIEHHLLSKADYTSNANPPTYPDGLDVEVMKFSILEQAFQKAVLPSDREHVTPYIRKQTDSYHLENVTHTEDLSNLRWTVDELDDFKFVEEIYSRLYNDNSQFSMNDILSTLKIEPELAKINCKYLRNEGYLKSLKNDLSC